MTGTSPSSLRRQFGCNRDGSLAMSEDGGDTWSGIKGGCERGGKAAVNGDGGSSAANETAVWL
jgi:hypothetical protein